MSGARHSLPAVVVSVRDEAWHRISDIEALTCAAVGSALAASGDALPDDAEVSIVLGDDAFIAGLNTRWRGIAKATNVLSFPVEVDSPALGDIVVAYETVAREAADEGKRIEDHYTHMIVHGFLHLLGFDHETEAEAEEMEAAECRALAALGIASPYDMVSPCDMTSPHEKGAARIP